MFMTVKKTLAMILTVAMLATGTTLLSSCGTDAAATDATDSTDATVILTEDTGAASTTGTTAAAVVPAVLPSVAPASISINGETITAAEYDFYYYTIYSNYAQYASYGAVPTVAADGTFDLEAACSLEGYEDATWGDFITDSALTQLQDSYILANYAVAENITLSEADQTTLDSFYTSVQTYADTYGMTLDAYLTTMYGEVITKEALTPVIERYLLAGQYMTSLEAGYTFTDAELEAYYTENSDSYENIDLPTVRHILFMAPVGIEGYTDATEEELTAAKALADAALAKITTYEDMVSVGDAALADASASESAEYTVANGDMVDAFETWCYDEARQPGDKEVVQSEYGYHVMYFVDTQKDWMEDALYYLSTEKYNAYIDEQEALPLFDLQVA